MMSETLHNNDFACDFTFFLTYISFGHQFVLWFILETTNEVPAMMSSLWKKLDYTLSQIR